MPHRNFATLPPSTTVNNLSPPPPPQNSSDIKPALFITIIILAIAIILSASLYLLLRFLRRRHDHHNRHRISPENKNPLINSLPLFPFKSLTGSITTADCAVCLSKFESDHFLRFLPLCCHAFHVECIDIWLAGNLTCPICRSPVFLSDHDLLHKFENQNQSESENGSSRSFRVEIGNVSRRVPGVVSSGEIRSYSISGSFDYVVNDVVSEVHVESFRWPSEIKVEPSVPPVEESPETAALAAEVGQYGNGGWLKEFLSSSRSMSFRGSGRWFFTGSSRRSNTELGGNRDSELDVEASRLGEEIGELFQWLSGM